MKSDLILVIGASGLVGSGVVQQLQAQGLRIRTTTSKKDSKQKDQVHLNLTTGEGLRDAFEGVDRAFLLSPAGYADQYSIVTPMIQEAKRRGLRKVVLMTAMGANYVETSPFRRAEVELEKSGLNYNIIRPNWFMQNFHTFWGDQVRMAGKIMLPVGDAKTTFIDSRDISEVAATLLIDDSRSNQAFDLTGPDALTHTEVAKIISEGLGKNIGFQDIQPEVLKGELLKAQLPADYVEVLLFILEKLKAGYSATKTESVQQILGRAPKSFADYLRDNKANY